MLTICVDENVCSPQNLLAIAPSCAPTNQPTSAANAFPVAEMDIFIECSPMQGFRQSLPSSGRGELCVTRYRFEQRVSAFGRIHFGISKLGHAPIQASMGDCGI